MSVALSFYFEISLILTRSTEAHAEKMYIIWHSTFDTSGELTTRMNASKENKIS